MFNFIRVLLQYYALDITYFKSSLDSHLLDLLWNKYWVNTLSSSPLLGNGDYVAGQISDLGTIFVAVYIYILIYFLLWTRMVLQFSLKCCVFDSAMFWKYECLSWNIPVAAEKLEQAENQLAHSRFGPLIAPTPRKKEVSDCFYTSYGIFIHLLEVLNHCIEVSFGLLKIFITVSFWWWNSFWVIISHLIHAVCKFRYTFNLLKFWSLFLTVSC